MGRGRGETGRRGGVKGKGDGGKGEGENIPQDSLPVLLCPVSGYVLQSITEKLILCLHTSVTRDMHSSLASRCAVSTTLTHTSYCMSTRAINYVKYWHRA